jgi:hypothetical protein
MLALAVWIDRFPVTGDISTNRRLSFPVNHSIAVVMANLQYSFIKLIVDRSSSACPRMPEAIIDSRWRFSVKPTRVLCGNPVELGNRMFWDLMVGDLVRDRVAEVRVQDDSPGLGNPQTHFLEHARLLHSPNVPAVGMSRLPESPIQLGQIRLNLQEISLHPCRFATKTRPLVGGKPVVWPARRLSSHLPLLTSV